MVLKKSNKSTRNNLAFPTVILLNPPHNLPTNRRLFLISNLLISKEMTTTTIIWGARIIGGLGLGFYLASRWKEGLRGIVHSSNSSEKEKYGHNKCSHHLVRNEV